MIYTAITYPTDAQGQPRRKNINIGNQDGFVDLYLKSVSFTLSVFEPVTGGTLVCTCGNPDGLNVQSWIKSGDVILIYEQEEYDAFVMPTPPPAQLIFTGVITTRTFSQASDTGTEIYLDFQNLLWQWSQQAAIDSINAVNQGFTDVASNQVTLGKFLSLMVQGSLFQLLTSEGVLGRTQTYNGVDLPVALGNLSLTDTLWTYIAVNMKKLDALTKTIYPYQQLLYQASDGTVVIDVPRLDQIQDSFWSFSTDTNNWKRVSVADNAASITNRVISTLIPMAFVPPTEGVDTNFIAQIDNTFTRAQELLQSGYFEVINVETEAINQTMITDPTLLTYLTQSQAAGYLVQTLQGSRTVAGTYAARQLAQQNVQHTTVTLTMPRKFTTTHESPLGKLICMDFPEFLDPSEIYMYCFEMTVDHSGATGTELTLRFTRPYSQTTLWLNGSTIE